jgi:hypothetical protein
MDDKVELVVTAGAIDFGERSKLYDVKMGDKEEAPLGGEQVKRTTILLAISSVVASGCAAHPPLMPIQSQAARKSSL